MIRHKEPVKEADDNYSVLDIENAKSGEVLAIGHTWREQGRIQHRVFASWDDWWNWVVSQADHSAKFRTIYAHNGGGWDWLSYLEWFIKAKSLTTTDSGFSIGLVDAQSNLVFLAVSKVREREVDGRKVEEKRWTIKLCDSMYILRSKLDDLAKKILGASYGKTESNIDEVWAAWKEDKIRFYAYLASDCELLLLVLEQALALIRKEIAPIKKLGVTIGSLAMDVFRHIWTESELYTNAIFTDMPDDVEKFCRSAYHGGRVEVFKYGYYKEVFVYDINSLYPFAMVTTVVPFTGRGSWVQSFRESEVGAYHIRWKQNRRDILPVLLDGQGNRSYDGSGCFYTPEIALLREVDPTATIEILKGWVFLDTAKLFNRFVDKLYGFRMSQNDAALSLLAKYILNSLYGKFAQKGLRNSLVVFDTEDAAYVGECENNARNDVLKQKGLPTVDLTRLDRDKLLYKRTEIAEIEHAHVAISGMITSQARVELYRMILAGGAGNVVYCDTDSIHCLDNRLDKYVSTALGKLKLEANGEGVYAGKKLYAIRHNGKTKIRAKGISVKRKESDHGDNMQFETLVQVLNGVEYKASFGRAATWRGVLSGQKACSIGSIIRKRTVRKT